MTEREPDPDAPQRWHVYPLFGREHVTKGADCWCHPEPDPECPAVLVHNVEH